MKLNQTKMMYTSIGLLLVLMLAVMMERFGIQAEETQSDYAYMPHAMIQRKKPADEFAKETLIVTDQPEPSEREEQLLFVLESMNVGYDVIAVSETAAEGPDLSNYRTVILHTTQTEVLAETEWLAEMMTWVEQGGRLWSALPDVNSAVFLAYPDAFGISTMEPDTMSISTIDMLTDFMVGSKGFEYQMEDFATYGLNLTVENDVQVHALQPETDTPIIWETAHGQGRIVVNNIDMSEKSSRGMLAAQYTLLEDAFAYPVINTSVFFLDDFPAPFPEGWDEHISKDFDMDVETFFSSVWLPEMMEMAEQYNLPFTNVLIVTYADSTAPPYDVPVDKETFHFYGTLMNTVGGEIGFHGYNHQPLVPHGFEFSEDLGYNTWDSTDDMYASLNSLIETTNWVFPEEKPSVYVPPSNILSEEARAGMREAVEEIRTIASLYAVTGSEYEQEFTVADDGIVELPRTVSGLELSEYDRWMALNELNFHFVNSHFFHPDDLLDVERGADKGWEYLKGAFEEYLRWLDDVAPGLRKQKASDGAKAIQRFAASTIERTHTEDTLELTIDNFYDEVYSIVRIREGGVESVDGGTMTPLTSELYLLKAEQENVTIHID